MLNSLMWLEGFVMDRINMEHFVHLESFIGQCYEKLLGFHIWTASSLKNSFH